MDKMEILKMALAHTPDPKAAMELARDMEAFLRRENPVPKWVTETIKNLDEPQPKVSGKPKNNRHPWDEIELLCLKNFLGQNYGVEKISYHMGRSVSSIKSAIMRLKSGEYTVQPTLTQKVNAGTFPGYKS